MAPIKFENGEGINTFSLEILFKCLSTIKTLLSIGELTS